MTRALVLLSLIFALAALPALAQDHMLTAKIPFDFGVRGKVLPAGDYQIYRLNNSEAWVVRSTEGRGALFMTVIPEANDDRSPRRLTFHRYGQEYFLAQVWVDGLGLSVKQSGQEAQVRAAVGRPVVVALVLKQK